MLPTDVLLQVKRQFGDEYEVIIYDSDIYNWIHEAELDIIRAVGTNDQIVSTPMSNFPINYVANITVKRITVNGRPLEFTTLPELDSLGVRITDGVGTPMYWFVEDEKITLYPTDPNSNQAVKITYNKTPVLLTGAAGEQLVVPESFHTDIVSYVLSKAHNKDKNFQAEKIALDQYQRNLSQRAGESDGSDVAEYKGGDPLDYGYGIF